MVACVRSAADRDNVTYVSGNHIENFRFGILLFAVVLEFEDTVFAAPNKNHRSGKNRYFYFEIAALVIIGSPDRDDKRYGTRFQSS